MTIAALVVGLVVGAALATIIVGRRQRDESDHDRVTAVRRASRVDAEAEARLSRALNGVPIGIVVFENGRAVFANRFARQFDSGRHSDVLVEQAIGELVMRASTEGSLDDELDLYGPPRRQLSLRALLLEDADDAPGRNGILVTIEDTSERRRVEAVRRDFVANVSHELKTPVGAMGVLAETLVAEEDSAVIQRLSERLHAEALRLGTTIDDLLTLSTIESGETFDPDDVDVGQVARQSLDRVRSAADLRKVSIEISTSGDLVVQGDRRQLESAIANLVDNSVKYSDDGAEVSVAVDRRADFVVVTVADSGDGIPERDLERIFERFYRVDQARSRSTGGTGLGLSIVRHVAINHGGKVSVKSKEGEGTTFVFKIKVDVTPSSTAEQSPDGEEMIGVG